MGDRDELLERAARLLETFGGTAPQYNGQVFAWLSDYEAHKSAETTEREREREDCR